MQQVNMENAQNGEDSTLYDRFAAIIFHYLFQQVSNKQDAEDLLLEVFLAALQDKSLSNLPAGNNWLVGTRCSV
jgi:RNA polymerase sigma-70 factor (ECF subfamily)